MIKIGIISPSEIALRRFLPALSKLNSFKFVGVAIAKSNEWESGNEYNKNSEKNKAKSFITKYGGKIFSSYSELINSEEIDAIYLPLPPSLHFKWGNLVLAKNKHLLIEKPATTSLADTKILLETAQKNNLALHENYMFVYHNQIQYVDEIMRNNILGDIRLIRISFGFPKRDSNDFRYNKSLGGGALLDCGGYTLKYASHLLGSNMKLLYSKLNYTDKFNVDISGSAAYSNEKDLVAQIAFGMDNSYKCDIEIWGSNGTLSSGRILTAPPTFIPEVTLTINDNKEVMQLSSDDTFMKSIQKFKACIENNETRINNYFEIRNQAKLVDEFLLKTQK